MQHGELEAVGLDVALHADEVFGVGVAVGEAGRDADLDAFDADGLNEVERARIGLVPRDLVDQLRAG